MGGLFHSVLWLGQGLLGPAARPQKVTSHGSPRAGVQMDAYSLPLLERPPAVPGRDLPAQLGQTKSSSAAPRPVCANAVNRCTGVVKKSLTSLLTEHLRYLFPRMAWKLDLGQRHWLPVLVGRIDQRWRLPVIKLPHKAPILRFWPRFGCSLVHNRHPFKRSEFAQKPFPFNHFWAARGLPGGLPCTPRFSLLSH